MSEHCHFVARPDGTVDLSGALTFGSVPKLFRDLERDLSAPDGITTIDLTAVSASDSAGLALLLEWQSRQRGRGRELVIRGAPDGLMRLAELCESVELLRLSGRSPQR